MNLFFIFKYSLPIIHEVVTQLDLGGPSIFQGVIKNLFPENIRPYLSYYIDNIFVGLQL